ncbi:unnamed protein product [Tilletia laevis]|uniref:Uncharacterized protein n=2 Tax=Tilletia TaxID=13289 RepID=A0A9N8LSG5_9BASI|nr:unnamed protein product [Tilletia caries]CAD6921891.1 unnamed protein product [Tilletia laevis]CAD6950699.1 unnamed protein product [Tilletia caries]
MTSANNLDTPTRSIEEDPDYWIPEDNQPTPSSPHSDYGEYEDQDQLEQSDTDVDAPTTSEKAPSNELQDIVAPLKELLKDIDLDHLRETAERLQRALQGIEKHAPRLDRFNSDLESRLESLEAHQLRLRNERYTPTPRAARTTERCQYRRSNRSPSPEPRRRPQDTASTRSRDYRTTQPYYRPSDVYRPSENRRNRDRSQEPTKRPSRQTDAQQLQNAIRNLDLVD